MKLVKKIWGNLEEVFIVILFFSILVTVLIQIIARELFSNPPIFTEELARFLFIWMVFAGFPYVTKKGTNLCLELAINKMSPKGRKVSRILTHIFSIAVFAFIGYHSLEFVEFSRINRAPAMRISMAAVYIILPISMAMCVIRSIELLVGDIREFRNPLSSGDTPEMEAEI